MSAAFWLKADRENGRWYLYAASEQIDETNFDLAYGEVVRLRHGKSDFWLDSHQIKVVGSTNPYARAVIEDQKIFPSKFMERCQTRLGNMSIQEAIIYPLPVTVPVPT